MSFPYLKTNLEPKIGSCPQINAIKTSHYLDTCYHLFGDADSADNSMKICVNSRNLRIELRFLG